MVPRLGDVGEGENLRRVSRGNGNGGCGALDGGDARGDGVGGGVGQAAVHVARTGQGELGGGVLGIVKLPRGRRVDGKCCGASDRIRRQASVNLQGVEVLLGISSKGGIELERHDRFLSRGNARFLTWWRRGRREVSPILPLGHEQPEANKPIIYMLLLHGLESYQNASIQSERFQGRNIGRPLTVPFVP